MTTKVTNDTERLIIKITLEHYSTEIIVNKNTQIINISVIDTSNILKTIVRHSKHPTKVTKNIYQLKINNLNKITVVTFRYLLEPKL